MAANEPIELNLPTQPLRVKGDDGEVIFEAPFFDVWYACIAALNDAPENQTAQQQAEHICNVLNAEFSGSLNWMQSVRVLDFVLTEGEKIKKNASYGFPESRNSTGSTRSRSPRTKRKS